MSWRPVISLDPVHGDGSRVPDGLAAQAVQQAQVGTQDYQSNLALIQNLIIPYIGEMQMQKLRPSTSKPCTTP